MQGWSAWGQLHSWPQELPPELPPVPSATTFNQVHAVSRFYVAKKPQVVVRLEAFARTCATLHWYMVALQGSDTKTPSRGEKGI